MEAASSILMAGVLKMNACEWQISRWLKAHEKTESGIRWNGNAGPGKTDLLFQWRRLQQKHLLSKFISLYFNASGLSLSFSLFPYLSPLPLSHTDSVFLSAPLSLPLHWSPFRILQDEHFSPLNHIPWFASPTHFKRWAFKKLIWTLKNTIANTFVDTEKAIWSIERVVNCQLEGNSLYNEAYIHLRGLCSVVRLAVSQTAPGAILYSMKS